MQFLIDGASCPTNEPRRTLDCSEAMYFARTLERAEFPPRNYFAPMLKGFPMRTNLPLTKTSGMEEGQAGA